MFYLRSTLSQKRPGRPSRRRFDFVPFVAAKFGIFDFFSDFLVIFQYSLALNVLIQLNIFLCSARDAMEFIQHYVPDADVLGEYDEQTVYEKLKNGQVLCKLINALESSQVVRKINTNNMAFKQMENIGKVLL